MKRYVRLICALLVIALGVSGLSAIAKQKAHEKLEQQVLTFEDELYAIVVEAEESTNNMDAVAMREQQNKLIALQGEIQLVMDEYDESDTEYLMYNELKLMISYYNELLTILLDVINNPWNLFTGMPEEIMNNILEEIDNHGYMYNKYKDELKLETSELYQEIESSAL